LQRNEPSARNAADAAQMPAACKLLRRAIPLRGAMLLCSAMSLRLAMRLTPRKCLRHANGFAAQYHFVVQCCFAAQYLEALAPECLWDVKGCIVQKQEVISDAFKYN
jgi:hypothetical protein